MAKHVYGLDLGDLPLDRISDKKSRRKRGINTLNLSHTRVSQQSSMIGNYLIIYIINIILIILNIFLFLFH